MKWYDKHDALNYKKGLYEAEDYFGFPVLDHQEIPEITKLIPFGARRRKWDGACHFFIEDYRFESVWNNPKKYIIYLQKFPVVFTPDFSIYSQFPIVLQMWQTYRNRWLGKYYQNLGFKVVPTVSWSDDRSYDFAFRGIPEGSTVAISTMGCIKDPKANQHFERGLVEMIDQIKPENIVVYGSKQYAEIDGTNVWFVPSTPDTIFAKELGEEEDGG